jgi:uridine kinase
MLDDIQSIVKRTGEVVPFDREKVRVAIYKSTAAVGDHDAGLADRAADEVIESLGLAYSADLPATVEDVQDIVERVLIKSGNADVAKAFILYRHERAKIRSGRRTVGGGNIPYKAMWQALDWAVEHGCHTVEALNNTIREGRLGRLVTAAEARYQREIEQAVQAVLERRDELRFIIVAGPSSSGKTTTTHKLTEQLAAQGVEAVPLALDNYFFDLELHPGDEFGDRDFETPEALDLVLINRHLAELDAGRAIDMPVYDFKTGTRVDRTVRFEAPPGSLIVLDTLHGLYAGLTESVPDAHKFRFYIETISQLKDTNGRYARWTDVRLLRRMVRDFLFRAFDPERTILHWHYVRRGELKHIIAHQASADFHFNGALPYELPFLKHHCFSHLPAFLERWRDNEKRLDGYIRARRLHDLLNSIESVADDDLVPATSLLREFIGGGAYDVH